MSTAEHDASPGPPETRVWRYMSLGKFLTMLHTSALFFCRVDKLDDQYEGTYPKLENPGPRWDTGAAYRQVRRMTTAVNCWHINEHESVAMWALYVGSSEGVVIASRVGRLDDAFQKSTFLQGRARFGMGRVAYVDYETLAESWPVGAPEPFLCKRVAYAHEQELRAFIMDYQQPLGTDGMPHPQFQSLEQGGLSVNVGLTTLIEEVRVSPNAAFWFLDLVKREVVRHGLDVPVQRSSLEIPPRLGAGDRADTASAATHSEN